jgi:hypothetical protein
MAAFADKKTALLQRLNSALDCSLTHMRSLHKQCNRWPAQTRIVSVIRKRKKNHFFSGGNWLLKSPR